MKYYWEIKICNFHFEKLIFSKVRRHTYYLGLQKPNILKISRILSSKSFWKSTKLDLEIKISEFLRC